MKLNHKFALLLAGAVLAGSLTGCGASGTPASSAASSEAAASAAVSEAASEPAAEAALPDGVYTADFDTDSSMFHANEACDGTSDEVYGFDIPVEALDEDFQLAILGSKGKWYDHTVRVANAQPAAAEAPADGTYTCDVTLEGGSGRATVESPAALTVADGRMTATIVWSSPNYDYMLVDGEKYLPTNTEGNSTFEIPVTALDTPLDVVGDTVAMSTPHEIEYTLTFASASLIEAK